MGSPQIISQGNRVHAINMGPDNHEWSASIQAPPVSAFSLSRSTAHLQKLDVVHAVPAPTSSSSAIATGPQVYISTFGEHLFATGNPSVVYHDPHLLPAPPSDSPSETRPNTGGVIVPVPAISGGLYPVVDYSRKNGTIVVGGDTSPHTAPPTLQESLVLLYAALLQNESVVILLPFLGLVGIGLLILAMYLIARKKPQPTVNVANTQTNTEAHKTPVKLKKNKEKNANKVEAATEKPATEQTDPNNTSAASNDDNSGSKEEPAQTKATPSKGKKGKSKSKKFANQLEFFANTSKKKQKAKDTSEEEVEAEPEAVEAAEVEGEVEAPVIISTKSERVVLENGSTRIGKLEITQTILGLCFPKISRILIILQGMVAEEQLYTKDFCMVDEWP